MSIVPGTNEAPGLFLHHERHAHLRGELLREDPHQHIHRAAGSRRNDEADGLFRVGGLRRRRECSKQDNGQDHALMSYPNA